MILMMTFPLTASLSKPRASGDDPGLPQLGLDLGV